MTCLLAACTSTTFSQQHSRVFRFIGNVSLEADVRQHMTQCSLLLYYRIYSNISERLTHPHTHTQINTFSRTLTSMRANTHTNSQINTHTHTHADPVLCPQGSGGQVEVRSRGVLSFDRAVYAQYPANSFQTLTVSYRTHPRTAGPHSTIMSLLCLESGG